MRKLLFLILFLSATCTSWAKYNPEVNVPEDQMADIKTSVSVIKRLPKLAREALITCKLGLLFVPDGSAAYEDEETFYEKTNSKYFRSRGGARFIASDGKMYGYIDVWQSKANSKPKLRETWDKASQVIFNYGEDNIFSAFKDEVTKLVLLTVKNRYMSMPKELRYLYIAEIAGYVYTPDGKNGVERWHEKHKSAVFRGTHRSAVYNMMYKSDVLLVYPDGREVDYRKMMSSKGKHLGAWDVCMLCENLVGAKDILALFPKDRDAMKEAYEKRTGMSAPEPQ